MRFFRSALFVVFCFSCALLLAQTPAKKAFEVASIKPAPPLQTLAAQIQSGKMRVGMTIDGARVDMNFMSLTGLVITGYKLKPSQIAGPDWMRTQLYEIHATIPQGATKDDVPEMLQALLAERFKLSAHRENKELPVYALVVSKGGPKLKEAVEEPPVPPAQDTAKAPPESSAPAKTGVSIGTPEGTVNMKPDGQRGMVITGGRMGKMRVSMGESGAMRLEIAKMTMTEFADLLSQFMDRPVTDMTDLKGSYQVALEIPMEELMSLARTLAPGLGLAAPGLAAPGGAAGAGGLGGVAASDPTGGAFFQAVQQLGLKLDSRKVPTEMLVIDHIEKEPTEN